MTRFYDRSARREVSVERVTEPDILHGVSIGQGDWILTPTSGDAYAATPEYYEANVIVYDTVPVAKPAEAAPVVEAAPAKPDVKAGGRTRA